MVSYAVPGSDDYEGGLGLEGRLRLWLGPKVGLGLSLGLSSWDFNSQQVESRELFVVTHLSAAGNISLIPIGGSLLLRPIDDGDISLTLEAGFRYVVVNSDIELNVRAADVFGNRQNVADTVDIEDGIVGVLGATLEKKLGPEVSLLIGIGYQFDVREGTVEFNGVELGDNELKALQIGIGLAISMGPEPATRAISQ